MFEVKIKGFETKDSAIEFMNWYSGQGEQDIDFWMECRKEEGKDIQESFNTKSINDNTLTLTLS